MPINQPFLDFDDEAVYADSSNRALDESTRNFVVEFGTDEAQIAFDLNAEDIRTILNEERSAERPVRWM